VTISRNWTAEERLQIVSAMLSGIQDDIYADRYSEPGRPNVTSVQGIIHEPPEVLEEYREQCEAVLAKKR
jgi:hypothetical protein